MPQTPQMCKNIFNGNGPTLKNIYFLYSSICRNDLSRHGLDTRKFWRVSDLELVGGGRREEGELGRDLAGERWAAEHAAQISHRQLTHDWSLARCQGTLTNHIRVESVMGNAELSSPHGKAI